MVNSKKRGILTKLRNTQEWITGEQLAKKLDISRVAVWKHIQHLNNSGYDICSSSRGYFLRNKEPLSRPWEFSSFADRVEWKHETSSTMEDGKRAAKKAEITPRYIIADIQTQGRGRKHRPWQSAEGGLYLSAVFRSRLPMASIARYLFAAMILVRAAVKKTSSIELDLKWPNDFLIDSKKAGGVLLEASGEFDCPDSIILGIGLNAGTAPRIKKAACLDQQNLWELYDAIIGELEKIHETALSEKLICEWKAGSSIFGRSVLIKTVPGEIQGTAADVTQTCGLVIESKGKTMAIPWGDCFYLS
ncbi:MAG: biotin--[acetyl-CoA-carboxylase] ligase [Spirochaetia bacterium]